MRTVAELAVVGHPFASIGMGEQLRAGLRALIAVGCRVGAFDVYRHAARHDPDIRALILPLELAALPERGIRIFHVNGDEVDGVLDALAARGQSPGDSYNVIVPAWELPRYPDAWVEKLRRFDEVWAISRFVQSSLAAAGIVAHHVGQSVEADFRYHLPRRFFGMRESALLLLNFLDTASFTSRKNPTAVLELFRRLRRARPYDDVQLVLKVRSGEAGSPGFAAELGEDLPRECLLLSENYPTHVARSMVGCSDCMVSLHRSEGFGRGMAEAMLMGRTALATGWSGNTDFMDDANSLFVRHQLVPVGPGQYPHWEGQHWAEPDIDHALHLLCRAIDHPADFAGLRRRGRRDVARVASNRAVGVNMLRRINVVCGERDWTLQ